MTAHRRGLLGERLSLEAAEGEVVADGDDEPEDGGGDEEGVDAVEDAAMAGEEGAGVLDAGTALEGGLEEVAELGGGVEGDGEEEEDPPGLGGVEAGEAGVLLGEPVAEQDEAHAEDAGGDDGGDGSFPGFVGREARGELVTAETLADVEGCDVAGPDAEEEEEQESGAVFFVEDLGEQGERKGDVDEHEDAGGGLPQDALEGGAEGGDGEEDEGDEGYDGDGVLGTKKGREKEQRDGGERPPKGDGAATGGGEAAKLQRGQTGDDGGEERDHPELAEEDQRSDDGDQDNSSKNALHGPC